MLLFQSQKIAGDTLKASNADSLKSIPIKVQPEPTSLKDAITPLLNKSVNFSEKFVFVHKKGDFLSSAGIDAALTGATTEAITTKTQAQTYLILANIASALSNSKRADMQQFAKELMVFPPFAGINSALFRKDEKKDEYIVTISATNHKELDMNQTTLIRRVLFKLGSDNSLKVTAFMPNY